MGSSCEPSTSANELPSALQQKSFVMSRLQNLSFVFAIRMSSGPCAGVPVGLAHRSWP